MWLNDLRSKKGWWNPNPPKPWLPRIEKDAEQVRFRSENRLRLKEFS